MPKLWHETIEAHRRGVREAIMDTAAVLVATHGLPAVTMSRIAAPSWANGEARLTDFE